MGTVQSFIPLDKSWTIRMGVLDLLNGHSTIVPFLEEQPHLNDDLQALLRAVQEWPNQQAIFVGESGTLFRFLQFLSWKKGLGKTFIKTGTLVDRSMHEDPTIVGWSQQELLTLDNGTSQWASAAVLNGDSAVLSDPPFKLEVTYKAVRHWKQQRSKGQPWEPQWDATIAHQATTFLDLIQGKTTDFIPQQAEDYCFARAFDLMGPEEGLHRWPNLQGHESNRIQSMEQALAQLTKGQSITSADHRVVQAIALKSKLEGIEAHFEKPEAVKKSWPLFWKFLEHTPS